MATIDWIFLAILGFFLLRGAWRGLVYSVLSLLNWVLAFFLARWLAPYVAQWLPLETMTSLVRYAAGFLLVFVVALFAGGFVAVVLRRIIGAVGLGSVDKTLGALFGLLLGVAVLLGITLVLNMASNYIDTPWQEATGPRIANMLLQQIKPLLPQEFGNYLP